jgi:hypothetical protein
MFNFKINSKTLQAFFVFYIFTSARIKMSDFFLLGLALKSKFSETFFEYFEQDKVSIKI